jgi:hypothetical protein
VICTPCGLEIPPNCKYVAVFQSPAGFRVEVGCEHRHVDVREAIAVLNSTSCAVHWFVGWLQSLRCNHNWKN